MKSIDWNDLLVSAGPEEVRRQIERGIEASEPLDWRAFEPRIRDAGGNVDALIELSQEINTADFHEAIREKLLKQIAKEAGVSIGALRAKRASGSNGQNGMQETDDGWLAELNERHAIVPVAGKVLVMNRDFDPALKRNMITFSSRKDFVLRYENRKTYIGGDKTDIGSAWIEHPGRRQYEGIMFSPAKDVTGYYNLFQGFGIDPNPNGSFDLFEEMVLNIICGGNSELFAYVWGWLAHLFQRPAELPCTALVLRGKQGTGKNTFVDAIGYLVGRAHYIALTSLQQITGRFTGHLSDALLVFANEAIWGGDKQAEGALKALITDGLSSVERKGQDIVSMRNYKRLIVASNEDWLIPRGLDDRRSVIIDVSDARKEDSEYFKAVKRQLGRGGFGALMHELLHADLSGYDPRAIPECVRETGWELKIRSGGSIVQWWFSVLDQGYLIKDDKTYGDDPHYVWPDSIEKSQLQTIYLHWCQAHRVMHPEVDCTVGKKLCEWGVKPRRRRKSGVRVNEYVFQTIEQQREHFSRTCMIPMSYWNDDEDENET